MKEEVLEADPNWQDVEKGETRFYLVFVCFLFFTLQLVLKVGFWQEERKCCSIKRRIKVLKDT